LATAGFVLCFGTVRASRAAAPALDDSSASAYGDGWDAGDNGGIGFGAWSFPSGLAAEFGMASSTTNGDGDTDHDGDIDVAGAAFRITSSSGGARTAKRPFGSPFVAGEILSVQMDPSFADNSQLLYQASIELLNASNGQRLRVGYFPGVGGWGVTDASGFHQFINLPATDEGMTVEIERLDDTTYTFSLIGLQPDPFVHGGTFASSGDIVAFSLTHYGVANSTMTTFWNSLHVFTAPEPGTAAGAAVGALGALATRRRRRR
jgi:hypothetical protein